MKTIDILSDAASYDRREKNRRRANGHDDTCIWCGRVLKGSFRWVSTLYGAQIVIGDVDIHDPAYSGEFPIGETCYRKALRQ